MSKKHKVREGDCMNSIAFKYGFFPDTLWNHPDNSELRDLRKADNVLRPRDIVIVPDLEQREESCVAEQRHRFVRKGVPAVLRIVFVKRVQPDEDEADTNAAKFTESSYEDPVQEEEQQAAYEPLSNAPYIITGDVTADGASDGDGKVEIPIVPDAVKATIIFNQGTEDEASFDLALGNIDPVNTAAGLRQRLSNLGYTCQSNAEEVDDAVRNALRRFQKDNDLEVNGESDQASQDKLVEVHGS